MIEHYSPIYEKLENLIRGSTPPESLIPEQFAQWDKAAKEAHPLRYWLAETLLYKLVALINWPGKSIHHLVYRINNRWIARTHALTAHPKAIPRGEWRDVGDRFLPCMFNELVNFVEIENPRFQVGGNRERWKEYGRPWIHHFFFLSTWRCPKAGIDHLKWQATLTNEDHLREGEEVGPSAQARAAMEILKLYTWWKEIIPARNSAEEAGDWDSYYELRRSKGFDSVPIGDEDEEEQMMVRLIRIRRALWL